jgi:hypothetical protein
MESSRTDRQTRPKIAGSKWCNTVTTTSLTQPETRLEIVFARSGGDRLLSNLQSENTADGEMLKRITHDDLEGFFEEWGCIHSARWR